jgi:heptaprenyl diphosphate synthase
MEFHSILGRLERVVSHPQLEKYLGKPPVPIYFVRFLFQLLSELKLPPKRVETYCIAATCLHMGLMIHERISLKKETELSQIRKRQLTVLAGDFYSSLFYRFLAEAGEIEGIQCLSKCTSEINEQKLLYSEENMEQLVSTRIWKALADFFRIDPNHPWYQWIKRLIHLPKAEFLQFCEQMYSEQSFTPEAIR